jgi:hypothetical protein
MQIEFFGNKLRRLPCPFNEAIDKLCNVKRSLLRLLLRKTKEVELGRKDKIVEFERQGLNENNHDEENVEEEDEVEEPNRNEVEETEEEQGEDQAPLQESEERQITRLKNFFRLVKIEELGNDGSSRESFSNELVLFVAQLSAEGVCNTGNW